VVSHTQRRHVAADCALANRGLDAHHILQFSLGYFHITDELYKIWKQQDQPDQKGTAYNAGDLLLTMTQLSGEITQMFKTFATRLNRALVRRFGMLPTSHCTCTRLSIQSLDFPTCAMNPCATRRFCTIPSSLKKPRGFDRFHGTASARPQ
jgi:hypothetical protein